MRRIMRMRGRRRNVSGGGGSGGRNGGRIRRDRETNSRTAMDLAVINELPVKPIGLGVTSNLSR
ncbi:BnaC04g47540D [Brassica napus]|uniref:BnaC04g47540D protein n=1 Tax=Brassica napus TaxID=3708 RepID=A0A078FPG6_BRANA|nr:BnaC04g47540D [Brassica napus]